MCEKIIFDIMLKIFVIFLAFYCSVVHGKLSEVPSLPVLKADLFENFEFDNEIEGSGEKFPVLEDFSEFKLRNLAPLIASSMKESPGNELNISGAALKIKDVIDKEEELVEKDFLAKDFCEGFCAQGATCRLHFGKATCICPYGFGGKLCNIVLRECERNPCLHSVKCVTRQKEEEEEVEVVDDGVEVLESDIFSLSSRKESHCLCNPGWTGDLCDRPCRDIYKSCGRWKRFDFCDQIRFRTRFFDLNCADTCGKCVYREETVVKDAVPLPPVLAPLEFMVGIWQNNFSRPWRHPIDFPPFTSVYTETLEIRPIEVPMFDTPAMSYTSTSVSPEAPEDIRIIRGYLKVKKLNGTTSVALLCSSNDGVNSIEKGTIENESFLLLHMDYMQVIGTTNPSLIPTGTTRAFRRDGEALEMFVKKLDKRNKLTKWRKHLYKIQDINY